jgi:hypothetical protein
LINTVVYTFKAPNFLVITITMLENYGIHITINPTVFFRMVGLDITDFEGE